MEIPITILSTVLHFSLQLRQNSINQSINQSIDRSINQQSTNQYTNQQINLSTDRSINRSINQSINHTSICIIALSAVLLLSFSIWHLIIKAIICTLHVWGFFSTAFIGKRRKKKSLSTQPVDWSYATIHLTNHRECQKHHLL